MLTTSFAINIQTEQTKNVTVLLETNSKNFKSIRNQILNREICGNTVESSCSCFSRKKSTSIERCLWKNRKNQRRDWKFWMNLWVITFDINIKLHYKAISSENLSIGSKNPRVCHECYKYSRYSALDSITFNILRDFANIQRKYWNACIINWCTHFQWGYDKFAECHLFTSERLDCRFVIISYWWQIQCGYYVHFRRWLQIVLYQRSDTVINALHWIVYLFSY